MVRWLVPVSGVALLMVCVVGVLLLQGDPPASADLARPPNDAVAHARSVERRALTSSFAALDAFGEAAAKRGDAEGLSRLQHVAWIVANQGDFEKAEHWNRVLRESATRQKSARYLAIADINAMRIRHLRDIDVPLADMETLAASQTDWMARVFAQTVVARRLFDEQRIGDAIRLMAKTIPLIPAENATEASVASAAWDLVSIAHVMIDDVPGHLKAIAKAEAYMAASDYPRPDYESVYNLTQSLAYLGRHDEALVLVDIYGRLAARTGTATSRGYAGNICAFAASSRDDWPAVLRCLEPFGPDLDAPDIVANSMLAFRATGHARTGQVALAQRDADEIRKRVANKRMSLNSGAKRALAELMLAKGDYANGVPALRDYHLSRFQRASQRGAAAMEQVVFNMDEQLRGAVLQNDLKTRVINTQRGLVVLLVLLGASLAALFWQQRRLARSLAEASRREREAHEAKSAFFANMSHEIRTPLNGIVAMADALNRAGLQDEAAHMVRIIASSGNTLERLLSDILDDAKMEAGQIEIEIAPFDLEETVRDVEALWTHRAAAKGVQIEARINDGAARWATGDRVRLGQVLTNLVSNALKFTTTGKVTVVAEATQGDRVRFEVIDTGVGFDAAQKSKIFERFQQADGTITRRFGGTGLGLSICRQLVRLMGGELDCDSTAGEGSRFWFEIVLPTVAPAVEPSAATPVDTDEEVPLRLLVVDDHAANRTILGLLLQGYDMEIAYAENGQEAVDAFREAVFDVVLMDMQMPVLDGLAATRAIRAMETELGRPRATVVMFSADAGSEHQRLGAEAGADGHIAKPVILERLLEGISLAMQRNQG